MAKKEKGERRRERDEEGMRERDRWGNKWVREGVRLKKRGREREIEREGEWNRCAKIVYLQWIWTLCDKLWVSLTVYFSEFHLCAKFWETGFPRWPCESTPSFRWQRRCRASRSGWCTLLPQLGGKLGSCQEGIHLGTFFYHTMTSKYRSRAVLPNLEEN